MLKECASLLKILLSTQNQAVLLFIRQPEHNTFMLFVKPLFDSSL